MKAPAFLQPLLGPDADSCVLVNQRGEVIASKVHGAFDSVSRKKGLLGRDGLADGEALIIAPCSAVHTFFMRFPIDVLYLNREGRVVRVKAGLRPWRIDACPSALAVVEFPAGGAAESNAGVGQLLSVVNEP